jgi:hypothetical protein
MEGFVYIIRNEDLYKIGHTDDLERRLKELKPTEVIAHLRSTETRNIEVSLHKRYANKRIPQTEYFRLSKNEVEEAVHILNGNAESLGETRQSQIPSKRDFPRFRRPNSIGTLSEAKRIFNKVSFYHQGSLICVFRYRDSSLGSVGVSREWDVGVLLEWRLEVLPKGDGRRHLKMVSIHHHSISDMFSKFS